MGESRLIMVELDFKAEALSGMLDLKVVERVCCCPTGDKNKNDFEM